MAGANVNDKTVNRHTALHIAALHDHSSIASILIENGVDFSVIDEDRNNGRCPTLFFGFVVIEKVRLAIKQNGVAGVLVAIFKQCLMRICICFIYVLFSL